MICSNTIAFFSILYVASGHFVPNEEIDKRNLKWGDITYVGPAFEGGPNVTITASSGQEIFKRLQEINPDYPWITSEEIIEKHGIEGVLAERSTRPPTGYVCGGRWGFCDSFGYGFAQRGVPTTGSAYNNPHTCGQVGCGQGCAVGWCNDNNYRREVLWEDLHVRWNYVANHCSSGFNCAGQAFFLDNTNAIIHQQGTCT